VTAPPYRRACAGADPAIFFPEQGGPASEAKAICGRCPHRQACLDWAIATGQAFGIWGGASPDERARMPIPDRRTAA
jgi:WhiB family redox-sensing transcriptional regulator